MDKNGYIQTSLGTLKYEQEAHMHTKTHMGMACTGTSATHPPLCSPRAAHFEAPIRLSVYLTTFQPAEDIYFYHILQLRNY